MKRWLIMVVGSLFLGAIMTALSSWYIAAFHRNGIGKSYIGYENHFPKEWTCPAPKGWPQFSDGESIHIVGIGHEITSQTHYTSTDSTNDYYSILTYSYGWPLVSLSSCRATMGSWKVPSEPHLMGEPESQWVPLPYGHLTQGWQTSIPFTKGKAVLLPLYPSPIGFAVNTAVFSTLWLGCIVGYRILVHRIRGLHRIRRGLCLKCGYTLAGLDTCPECNTPAPQKAAVT